MNAEFPASEGPPSRAGRWAVVAFLVIIAMSLLVELLAGSQPAAAQVTTAQRTGQVLAVAGQITGDTYGLYLVDLERGIITMYQWAPKERKLRLLAARNFSYDLQLDEYNTEPSPKEIRDIVGQSRRLGELGPP
jgi:hypothetical protein